MAATFVQMKTERQMMMERKPGYFEQYSNLAAYKGSLPPAALPQTAGVFVQHEPLRPNVANALAQLQATAALDATTAAPADDEYARSKAGKGLAGTYQSGLRASTLTSPPKASLRHAEQERRAKLREDSIDPDVKRDAGNKLTGSASMEALRGGTRSLANSYSVVAASEIPGNLRLKQAAKWTNLKTTDVSSLLIGKK